MADENNRVISGSSYDLQEKWLNEIAPKYFKDVDLSTLRVGLFGYINEIMGTAIEDDYFRMNFLSDETMLSTARTAKSLYEYANRYNVVDINAKPSKTNLIMYVPTKEILQYMREDENATDLFYFEFSNNGSYLVDGKIPFMQDHTIQIQIRSITNATKDTPEYYDSNNYSFSVRYLTANSNNLGKLNSPYIKSFKMNLNGIEYLVMNLDLYQVKKETQTFNVYSENTVDLINFEAEFSGQLSNFNVDYIERSDKITRLSKVFNGYNINNLDEYFCYYKYDGDNKLQIYFSGLPEDFRPAYNSTLEVEMFTTLGEEGNFEHYNNQAIEYQIDMDDPIRSQYNYQDNQLNLLFSINGGSSGGANKLTLEEVRKLTISEASARKTITTETNLNSYFNSIIEKSNKNGSILRFFKKVDDILERIYAAYFVLFDTDHQCIPTNTVNLKLSSKNSAINLRDPSKDQLNFALENFNINIKSNTQFTIILPEFNNKLILNNDDKVYIIDEDLANMSTFRTSNESSDDVKISLSKNVSYVTAKKKIGENDFTTSIFDSSLSSTNSPLNETSIVNNSHGDEGENQSSNVNEELPPSIEGEEPIIEEGSETVEID